MNKGSASWNLATRFAQASNNLLSQDPSQVRSKLQGNTSNSEVPQGNPSQGPHNLASELGVGERGRAEGG